MMRNLICLACACVLMNVSAHATESDTQAGRSSFTSGRAFENVLESILARHGFHIMQESDYDDQPARYDRLYPKLALRNADCINIYGDKCFTEFVVKVPERSIHARIESKWQSSSGSVKEKLPFVYLNGCAMSEPHFIFVYGGTGWGENAINWIRNASKHAGNQCYDGTTKRFSAFDIDEFKAWIEKMSH